MATWNAGIETDGHTIDEFKFIEPYSPNDMKYLLKRLTMKYNCNLDIKICYTLYELLENGESVIIDYFSRPQLLYIMDFIFAIKTYQKVSVLEIKTLIFCQLKWLDSVFKELDVVRLKQHTTVMLDGSFDLNGKILVLRKLERNFLDKLNKNLLIDSSYLLIILAKKRNAKFVNIFNQLNSSFIGLSEEKVKSFPNKPFTHIRGNGFGGFEVKMSAEVVSNSTEMDQVRDDDELLDSISIPDIPFNIREHENEMPVVDPITQPEESTDLLSSLIQTHFIQSHSVTLQDSTSSVMDQLAVSKDIFVPPAPGEPTSITDRTTDPVMDPTADLL